MADTNGEKKKRKTEDSANHPKRLHKESPNIIVPSAQIHTAGKIHRIYVRNFMCHDSLEIVLNHNVNFIIGRNGSGKSALLTALTVGLGARANVTKRGDSVKEFIKKGKNSSTIEITLLNEGPTSFKPEAYGKTVTVIRTIGNVSTYKLKSASGKTISTKKDELDHLLSTMNIQVENPISVLNQDVSRSFLTTASASDKYNLFMKSTQMDIIGNNYKEAQLASEEARRRLQDAEGYLADSKREVTALEKSLQTLNSIEDAREQLRVEQLELSWANAIAEETKLCRVEYTLAAQQKNLDDIEGVEDMRESKEKEIAKKVAKFNEDIREIQLKTSDNSSAFKLAQENYHTAKDAYTNKKREWLTIQTQIRRVETDIADICQEIQRLENSNDGGGEKARLKDDLTKCKAELEECEAMLRTKQTEQMHLSTDKVRLEQEEHAQKIEVHHRESHVRNTKQKLMLLKQQSDSPVTIYGSDMPRLLKRIEEEHRKGRFQEKPMGPLGTYIKIKDSAWTPAVEKYLGANILGGFAVDNGQDAKVLGAIMNELYRGQRPPNIVSSKFFHQVHDVRQQCTRHPNYINLLDVMEISEPIVANCLIDQREPECVLLIPLSAEAAEILKERCNVPPNCKRALTQKGDEFFPDPNYRTYGGKVGRSKFLQVSTKDAIASLQEELGVAEEEQNSAVKLHRIARDKLQRSQAQLSEVSTQVTKLKMMRQNKATTIESINDKLDVEAPDNTTELNEEKALKEKKFDDLRAEEKRLMGEMDDLRQVAKIADDEVKRLRELTDNMENKVNKIKEKIRALDDEKEMFTLKSQHVKRKMMDARQAVQKTTADYEVQKRVTDKLVADAEALCPRIDTKRSVAEIKRSWGELRAKIHAVEQNVGSREELETELAAKRAKYCGVIDFANDVSACNDRHLIRLHNRREIFREVKKCVGVKVQTAFSSILRLRQYKGSIKISHSSKTLELEVIPQNTAKKTSNDARTLSGGERSYSTVAFILALWDCIGLPFYFLDEFDVFMDKVNRRIILDILLDHTRCHPQSQFAFLTPLDTSVQAGDYLTIHKLAPPERNGDNQ